MKVWTNTDLIKASDAIENLLSRFDNMTLETKVDVGARLRAIIKNAEKLDEQIKGDIKKKLKEKPGSVAGDAFKATLAEVPVSRCDVKALKEKEPEIYADYVVDSTQKRITYEAR